MTPGADRTMNGSDTTVADGATVQMTEIDDD